MGRLISDQTAYLIYSDYKAKMRRLLFNLSAIGMICWLHGCHGAPGGSDVNLDDVKPKPKPKPNDEEPKLEIRNSCGSTLTSSSGQLKTPNYPGNYGNNVNCVWVISAPEGTRIILSFMAFKLENRYDYLYIRDGNSASSPMLQSLTGDRHFADIVSSGNHLHITFTSDFMIDRSGFYISWEFERPSPINIVEQYAPKLRFDSKFGESNKCFPSSAASYYNARASGNWNRICNTDYSTITNNQVPTYWRAMECGDDLHIAYWFFSGYQDTCSPGQGNHNADWEHVIVKVRNYKSTSRSLGPVQFYQHSGWYTKNPGEYSVDGTHPIVYSGKNSHGSYHDDGGSGGCCYWEDYRNPGRSNKFMRTWLNLEELRRTASAPSFMKDLSSSNKFEMASPLERAETYELCSLPGCHGHSVQTCHTSGCAKSQVDRDDIF